MPRAGQPGAAKFVPGPVPRTSLAPTSGPDVLYSGLLECPLTTRIRKVIDKGYGLRGAGGSCGDHGAADAPIATAAECFAAVAETVGAGADCSHAVGSDSSRPPGCSVVADAQGGGCSAYFNEAAGGARCGAGGAGGARAGASASLVNVSVALDDD